MENRNLQDQTTLHIYHSMFCINHSEGHVSYQAGLIRCCCIKHCMVCNNYYIAHVVHSIHPKSQKAAIKQGQEVKNTNTNLAWHLWRSNRVLCQTSSVQQILPALVFYPTITTTAPLMDVTYVNSLYSNEDPIQVCYSSVPCIDTLNSPVNSQGCLCLPKRYLNRSRHSIASFQRQRKPTLSSGVIRLLNKVYTLKASLVVSTMEKATLF